MEKNRSLWSGSTFNGQDTTILNSLPIGVGIYDCDGNLIYLNDRFNAILSEVNISDYNIYNSPAVSDDVKELIRNGKPIHMRFPYCPEKLVEKNNDQSKYTNTQHLECNGSPILNVAGEVENYLLAIEDATEKIRNEQALRSSRCKVDMAMKVADIMLWEFDVLSRLFFSDNEPLNGYDGSEPLTIDIYMKNIHSDDQESMLEVMNRMCAGEDFSFSIDERIRFADNQEWQYCTVSGSPYACDAAGRVVKYVGVRKNNTDIQKQKKLQEKILNSIPLPIHIKDVEKNFRYTFCNDASREMFGTSIDKTTFDVMDKEGVERIQKTDLEVFNTGTPYMGLERISLKDGRSHDTIVRKSVIEDNGRSLLLSIRWDQGLQNELKRRSQLLALTLEMMNSFTWFYEPDKQRISFGDGLINMGRNASEVNTLEKYLLCVHPDDRELFEKSLQSIVTQEAESWRVEYRLDLNGDGIYQWRETRGILETAMLNDVPYTYMFGMTICIDGHKQAELALLRNKEKLDLLVRQNELVLNNTNSGLAYIDKDYIVQWENLSTCSKQVSFEAYKKGEKCFQSAHNRTSPCEDCLLQRATQSHQTEQAKFSFDGQHIMEVFATPVFLDDDSIDGIVIRVDDVTEREQIIEELREAKKLAEASDRLKSAFLANMSHEIRTPLNAIVGFSELLMSCGEEDKPEYMQIINRNNELLLKLINDILDLSKIEAGSIELKYEEFDLSEHFNGLVASMKHRVTNPNVRLMGLNPYASCRVHLDCNRVAQILTNYATNAIKYTPKGFIEIGYEYREGGIYLFVKDSGIGIADEKKEKVFHRFEKLDEFAQGTGLGLSICKAIAESMGGSVGFETKQGEGSLFWAFLPCVADVQKMTQVDDELPPEGEMTVAVKKSEEKEDINGMKTVLIAEDIQSNYMLVNAMLRNNYKLQHALNGCQAVEMVRKGGIDLVFMDMKMPEMDGLVATAEIRKFNQELPIIALTAHAFETDRIAAIAAGCNDYLIKPINKSDLMAVLQKYCG